MPRRRGVLLAEILGKAVLAQTGVPDGYILRGAKIRMRLIDSIGRPRIPVPIRVGRQAFEGMTARSRSRQKYVPQIQPARRCL